MKHLLAMPFAALAAGLVATSALAAPALELIGGSIVGSPSVVHWGNAKQDKVSVFVQSRDENSLWWRTRTNNRWGGWEEIGGDLASPPSCTALEEDALMCVVTGTDRQVYVTAYGTKREWVRYNSMQGSSAGAPALAIAGPGSLTVAVRNTDGALAISSTGRPGPDWVSAAAESAMVTDPGCDGRRVASIRTEVQFVDCFAMVAGEIWHYGLRFWPADLVGLGAPAPGAWSKVGGQTLDRPAPVWLGKSSLYVFVTGTDGALWQAKFDKGWKWSNLGGRFTSAPGCDGRSWDNPGETIYCAFRASDGSVQFGKLR